MKALLAPLNPILEDRPDRDEIEIKNKQLSKAHELEMLLLLAKKKKKFEFSYVLWKEKKKSRKMKAYIREGIYINSTMHERRNTRNERNTKLFLHNTTNSGRSQSNLFRNFLVHTRLLIWAHTVLSPPLIAYIYVYRVDTDMGLNAIMQSGYKRSRRRSESRDSLVYRC